MSQTSPAKRVNPMNNQITEKNPVQVIARAAAILRALEDEMAGLSLGQIAERVGLARSTVQRVVGALEAEQLVIPASPTGKVRLGPAILRLSASVQTDMLVLVHPYLVDLSKKLSETVDYAVVRKNRLVFIDQSVAQQRLRTVSVVGETFPLHCTANGKAYLSELSPAEIEKLLGNKYERLTPSTRATITELMPDLDECRRCGFATDLEEHTEGVCAIGVSFKDMVGNSVALSVPVPKPRYQKLEKQISTLLLKTKRDIIERFALLSSS